ncbi:MAG TPA: glycoside hydrolase family 18 protein [Parafilimonas sp.]|nr:glycoside hydrolase family 18 protein [Parafilimonas sp.]
MNRYIVFILTVSFVLACSESKHKKNNAPLPANQAMVDSIVSPDSALLDTAENIYPPAGFGIKKVGYVLDFRSPASIPAIRFKQCNVMIFAFAYVNKEGLYFRHPENLISLSKRSRETGCKILMGIGGSHFMFKYITATAERRSLLVNQVMHAIAAYNLNGVDIDWEFPAIKDKTNEAFTLFLKQLSDSCHKGGKYYLSCAVTPGVNGGRRSSAIDAELLTGNWVDWFNVMVYDDFSETKPYQHHSDINMAVTSFKYWLRVRKMKKEKCVMGLPLYGRPSGIKQPGRVKTYADILQSGGNPYRDSAVIKIDTTKIKDSLSQYTIYYDGIKTIQKKAKGAVGYGGGIMFWETAQDVNSKYSLIAAAVKAAMAADTAGKKIPAQ